MTSYDHAFTIAFSVKSDTPDASDITPAILRAAIVRRLASLPDDQMLEAVGAPFDTSDIS